MGGLIVLSVLVAYIVFAGWHVARFPWRWRVPVALIWIALPTADAVLGRGLVARSCEEGLQVQVKRTVPPVATIYTPGRVLGDSPRYYGYAVVEGTPIISPSGLNNLEQDVSGAIAQAGGKASIEEITERTARYGLFEAAASPPRGPLQVFRRKASVLGDAREHAPAEFFAIMESKDDIGPTSRASVRCEPDCRLILQPDLRRAASTRLALAEGRWLMRPQEGKC